MATPKKPRKARKSEPELISLSELARRAGVTRGAVGIWLKRLESWGSNLAQPSPTNRRGKMVDANDPLVQGYISKKAVAYRAATAEKGKELNHKLRKLRYQAEKLRLQNIALREKYIDREAVWALCEKLIEAEAAAFAGNSDRLLDRIENEFAISIAPENRARVKELMDNAIEDVQASTARIISDFKRETTSPYYASKKTA